MAFVSLVELDLFLAAAILHEGATALEFASGGRIKGAGDIALERFLAVSVVSLARGDGGEECEGVRVQRVVK
jgi:hypothetical protein